MEILLFFSSCSFIFSCLFFNYELMFQFEQLLISKFLSSDFWKLRKVILIHIQIKVACYLNHSFLDFFNLLILGKSCEIMDEPLECLFPDAIHVILWDHHCICRVPLTKILCGAWLYISLHFYLSAQIAK